METWKLFLANWNGKKFFLQEPEISSESLEFYTDACGDIGFGGYFRGC